MRDNHLDRKKAGWSISTVLSCPRAAALQETYDYYEAVETGWNKSRGAWIHAMMEADDDPTLIKERRIERILKVYYYNPETDKEEEYDQRLTGKPDEVDPVARALIDYKSKHLLPRKPDYRHECQFNGYVWLLADGTFVDNGEPVQIEIVRGGMHYVTWDIRKRSQWLKMGYPVWPLDETEEFLRERLRPLVLWKQTSILPRCNPLIRYGKNWQCDCEKLEEQLREQGVYEE